MIAELHNSEDNRLLPEREDVVLSPYTSSLHITRFLKKLLDSTDEENTSPKNVSLDIHSNYR